MTQLLTAQRLTRRQLLGAAAVSSLALAGATIYGAERWTWGAPEDSAVSLAKASSPAAHLPAPPLLLLTPPAPRPHFHAYLAEILRTEGLLTWRSAAFDEVDHATLFAVPVTLLAPGPLNDDQAALLQTYVARGGALIAIRPDPRLAAVCGVRYLGVTAPGDYLRRAPAAPASLGDDPGPLQVHGPYDRLAPVGAQALAVSAGGDPLVTIHRFGQGMAALWAFDLARCIALLRQGNPAWIGLERDGMEGIRSSDLFVGWVDLERIHVPQADEHQRLLVAVIEMLAAGGPPLPRLWHFPDGAPAALVMTGDAHGSRVSHIEQALTLVERHGGTMSIYYTPPAAGPVGRLARKARRTAAELPLVGRLARSDDPLPAPRHVADWRARGHEFGMHPYVEEGLEEGYNYYWNEFLKYGYGPLPPTVRTHRILWYGWVENARVQARYGIRMNLDHYHSGGAVRKADGTWTFGYLSGTGLPMRFVTEDGDLLSVYQQPTHLVDEHLMNVFDTGYDMGLDGTAAAAATIAQIAESVRRFPAALGLQCHVDPFLFGGEKAHRVSQWLATSLAYAASQRLPILSAERWLAFTEARATTHVTDLSWDRSRKILIGAFTVPQHGPGALTMLLPRTHADAVLRTVHVDSQAAPWRELGLAGRTYAAFAVPAGRRTIEAQWG